MAPNPVAPGHVLETQILRPGPRAAEWEILGVGPRSLGFHKLPPWTWTKLCPPYSCSGCRWRSHSLRQTEAVGYLDLVVACWGGVAAPLGSATQLPVGGPGRPVSVSLLCRRGRSIVCAILSWGRKGNGGHIRSSAECLLPGHIAT